VESPAQTTNDTTERESGLPVQVKIYLELAKARLATLVVLTTVAGYLLAARGSVAVWTLLWTVLGTSLTAFGANILNQCMEMERDRLMLRTRARPLPAGRISRQRAARWGVISAITGLAVLAVGSNLLTAVLAMSVILLYLLVYTPLKVRSPLNTVVGAVCGAIPPMMGWTAAAGRLELGAWILFGVLFLWQIPHFLALAWLHREDYARGGFRMLPTVDRDGVLTGRVILLYALGLLPVCMAASLTGISGPLFLITSQVVGLAFAALAWHMMNRRTATAARRLFLASLLYLPVVLGLMVADASPPESGQPHLEAHATVEGRTAG
jgi:protoheme IX farnesyltransferase